MERGVEIVRHIFAMKGDLQSYYVTIWGSRSGGYEEFYLLRYNPV
jgi:hypothetical protein